jgi:hypothetical protein
MLRRSAAALPLLLAIASCGTPPAAAPTRDVPAYSGRAAQLFDDSIEPAGVGLDYDRGYNPKTDPAVRERAQVGDAVLRVKVTTVTSKKDGPDSIFRIGLVTVEKLAGGHPPPTSFSVEINKTSESLGIMKNFESRLVGYSFIVFIREFARVDGEREYHFHLAPDSKDVKLAVSNALLLGETK